MGAGAAAAAAAWGHPAHPAAGRAEGDRVSMHPVWCGVLLPIHHPLLCTSRLLGSRLLLSPPPRALVALYQLRAHKGSQELRIKEEENGTVKPGQELWVRVLPALSPPHRAFITLD